MKRVGLVLVWVIALTVGLIAASQVEAAIVIADFNTDEGPFNAAPNFSGTSVGESSASTADRVITDGPREGAGHQKLVLVHDGSATNMRIRHLAGFGLPAGSNPTFTTSAGVDGWIGFYLKTTGNTGWTVGLNLDDFSNTSGGMDMGVNKPIIADGQWHLYEWNLDDDAQWFPVTSIGGDGTIQNGQHSIDSIYLFTNQTGTSGQARPPIFLDFVAKSDIGSIGLLPAVVPEASSFLAVGLAGLSALGVVWSRKKRAAVQQAA